MVELREHQLDAVKNMRNGCILWGGVGSGKTLTALTYYVEKEAPKNVLVITTAMKRDRLDWEREGAKLGIGTKPDGTLYGIMKVDSWNNLMKYSKAELEGWFIIFDEQRLVGYGAWVKAFLKLVKTNNWVMLSATPGDVWMDYAPVFIANGYYKNITDFKTQHVMYSRGKQSYMKIDRYVGTKRLERCREAVLVEMTYATKNRRVMNWLSTGFDEVLMKSVQKTRWNPYTDEPMVDAAELFRVMRRIGNSDDSKLEEIRELMKLHPRLVVFYNFNYELEMLRGLSDEIEVAEWNGHRKQELPVSERWLYVVQYASGAEGWNCTTTNAMVLMSLTHSYKAFTQALGRIDRMDTGFDTLYYYVLTCGSVVDRAIKQCLVEKRDFNERRFSKLLDRK